MPTLSDHENFPVPALTTDTGHITRPSVEGQAASIRAALGSAGCDAAAIDAINAQGTGT